MARNGAEAATAFPIVVGVELDETGQHALAHACGYATSYSCAVLYLARALTLNPGVRPSDDMVARELDELRRFAAPWMCDASIAGRTQLHVAFGNPVDVIGQLAYDVSADLIVVGTHGRRGLERFLRGSVAQELVVHGPCPVLVAKPHDGPHVAATPVYVRLRRPRWPRRTFERHYHRRATVPFSPAAIPAERVRIRETLPGIG